MSDAPDHDENAPHSATSGACIEFDGSTSHPEGYGMVWYRPHGEKRKRKMLAHRVAWLEAYGPIPDGLIVMRACRNPRCVAPAHLRLCNRSANVRDSYAKGRDPRAKLTLAQAREILADPRTQREIAKDYGVHQTLVSRIKRGEAWNVGHWKLRRKQSTRPPRCNR
jgi:hypothetical protein